MASGHHGIAMVMPHWRVVLNAVYVCLSSPQEGDIGQRGCINGSSEGYNECGFNNALGFHLNSSGHGRLSGVVITSERNRTGLRAEPQQMAKRATKEKHKRK